MSGIRVFGLAPDVTDKQLKVYFSNPKNGGGRVDKIYYPLPHNSGVVIFGDKQVAAEVVERQHQFSGADIDVCTLPRSVYRRVVTEVQKDVSEFLNVNPQLVDELQFIGEISVNFNYDKERYFLDGTWYQLEWALHYLDTMLEAFQYDSEDSTNYIQQRVSAKARQPPVGYPRGQQISRPNIPVSKSHEAPASLPPETGSETGSKMSNLQKFAPQHSAQVGKMNKNKNVMPGVSQSVAASKSVERKMYGDSVRSNLDKEDQSGMQRTDKGYYGDDDWMPNNPSGFGATQDDSDSENEALLAAQYKRNVGFTKDTKFQDRSRRPVVPVPKMTEGIDVAQTDFGDVPLSFTFELAGNLHIQVAFDDITQQTTDVIVNPTTANLSNVYGVSRAITKAAGPDMQIACDSYVEENGQLHLADVMHTAAGGKLNTKVVSVLHTVGPHWRETESEMATHLLVCTYINCFQYADQKLWAKSIATPLISAGAFGFPLDVCISAFYDAILMYSSRPVENRHLKEVRLVCFDKESAGATIMIIQSLLDCDKSQSAVSATDRYWLRAQKFNFQAIYFQSARNQDDFQSDSSDDEAENKPKAEGKYKKDEETMKRCFDADRNKNKEKFHNTSLASSIEARSVKNASSLVSEMGKVSHEGEPKPVVSTVTNDDNSGESDEEETGREPPLERVPETCRKSESEEESPERLVENKVDISDDDDNESDLNTAGYSESKETHAERRFSLEREIVEETGDDVITSNVSQEEHPANDEEDDSDGDKEEMMPVFSEKDERTEHHSQPYGSVSLVHSGLSIVSGNDVRKSPFESEAIKSPSGTDVKKDLQVFNDEEENVEEKEKTEEKDEEEGGLFL